MKKYIYIMIGSVLFLSGCMTSPKYSRPQAPVPTEWPSGAAYRNGTTTQTTNSVADLSWQEFFPDQKLQKLIETALNNNRDLRLAALNVEKARAIYGIQRADLFPALNIMGGGGKQHSSADLTQPGMPRTTEQYDVNLGVVAWEIDLFGRIRSLKKQALQNYLATEEARRGAQIALISEVAQVYMTLAADRENLKLAQSTLTTQKDAYNLIRLQYEKGVATEIDLQRVQTQMDAAKVDIARYTQLVAQDMNALNLLAGSQVPNELLPSGLSDITPLKEILPGISSEVLLKRPDIMAAEHKLKSAYAFIGAARAAFFPRISLTTTIGTASDELSGLFGSDTGAWSFMPRISMPIFDARTWAAYRVSKTTREIALAQYEKAIQTAFREVADTLAVSGTVDQQVTAQQSIVKSSQKIYDLSGKRYTQGIDGYLSVLDAQRSLYAAQRGLISLQLASIANQIRLYAVLGGGGKDTPNKNKVHHDE
jgi:multidrug efflux system outer membrane protein